MSPGDKSLLDEAEALLAKADSDEFLEFVAKLAAARPGLRRALLERLARRRDGEENVED
jgi:hypothetical protein